MGNHLWRVCQNYSEKSVKEIKLVDPDGCLRILLECTPVSASEIMKRYPKYVVAHADSFYMGHKVPVLSTEAKLEAGQTYFLLPEMMSGSVLSAALLASFAAGGSKSPMAVSPLHRRFFSATSVEPFQIEKSEDGRLQLKILPVFIQKLLEDGKMSAQSNEDGSSSYSGLCSTPQLQKDYKQLVKGTTQLWRPKLETIVEKERKCKLFGFKRKCTT